MRSSVHVPADRPTANHRRQPLGEPFGELEFEDRAGHGCRDPASALMADLVIQRDRVHQLGVDRDAHGVAAAGFISLTHVAHANQRLGVGQIGVQGETVEVVDGLGG